jgi:glycosyltransferase involved in cell wall biosynthesis
MLQPGMGGGVEQAVQSTVASLGRLVDGDEQYTVFVDPIAPHWLDHVIGANTRVVVYPKPMWRLFLRRVLSPAVPYIDRMLRTATTWVHGAEGRSYSIPRDEFLARSAVDVFHFPYQWMVDTGKPSLFNPQDVQHLYYPEFFKKSDIVARKVMYPSWCEACSLVDVPSQATKSDLIQFLNIPPEKIAVVPKCAPTQFTAMSQGEEQGVLALYKVPEDYIIYPAQTWPHKNHIRLLQALALLRDNFDLRICLICTGRKNDHWPTIRSEISRLNLASQVQFLGYISQHHLSILYQRSLFTVFPTLFEGGGLPLLEAFHEGSALACSDIPVLAQQVGDAAVLFDPRSVESIANALRRLHSDANLRNILRERGSALVQQYSWDRTARTYRAIYRKLAAVPLADEDQRLLHAALQGETHSEDAAYAV